MVRGIPTTTVVRSIIDLAEDLSVHQLARVMDQARRRGKLNVSKLERAVSSERDRRSYPVLRAALRIHLDGSAGTISPIEDIWVDMSRKVGMPEWRVNVWVSGPGWRHMVDFVCDDSRLCIETDGVLGHGLPSSRAQDRVRDRHLRADGWKVMRVRSTELFDPACALAAARRVAGVRETRRKARVSQ